MVEQSERVEIRASGTDLGRVVAAINRAADEARAGGRHALNLARLERQAIGRALYASQGNKARAAELLGISPGSLYMRLRAFKRVARERRRKKWSIEHDKEGTGRNTPGIEPGGQAEDGGSGRSDGAVPIGGGESLAKGA